MKLLIYSSKKLPLLAHRCMATYPHMSKFDVPSCFGLQHGCVLDGRSGCPSSAGAPEFLTRCRLHGVFEQCRSTCGGPPCWYQSYNPGINLVQEPQTRTSDPPLVVIPLEAGTAQVLLMSFTAHECSTSGMRVEAAMLSSVTTQSWAPSAPCLCSPLEFCFHFATGCSR